MDFIRDVQQDPVFSDPMLSTDEQWENNLLRSAKREDEEVLGVYREGKLAGFFVFQITVADRNLEMIVGLSRSAEVYTEIADYLQEKYPGFQADFVFNLAGVNRPKDLAEFRAGNYDFASLLLDMLVS